MCMMGCLMACQEVEVPQAEDSHVTFSLSSNGGMDISRAQTTVEAPTTLFLTAYKNGEVYKEEAVLFNPAENNKSVQWTMSANQYRFDLVNYKVEDEIYKVADGRGLPYYYATHTEILEKGKAFTIPLTATVQNSKLSIVYVDGFNVLENCTTVAYLADKAGRKIQFPANSDPGPAWFPDGSRLVPELTYTYNGISKKNVYSNALSKIAPDGVMQPAHWYNITLTPTVAQGNITISVSSAVEQIDGNITVDPKAQ